MDILQSSRSSVHITSYHVPYLSQIASYGALEVTQHTIHRMPVENITSGKGYAEERRYGPMVSKHAIAIPGHPLHHPSMTGQDQLRLLPPTPSSAHSISSYAQQNNVAMMAVYPKPLENTPSNHTMSPLGSENLSPPAAQSAPSRHVPYDITYDTPSQVLRDKKNTFLGGYDFCFDYIFKTNFSGNKKIWGALPRMPPVVTGLPRAQTRLTRGRVRRPEVLQKSRFYCF